MITQKFHPGQPAGPELLSEEQMKENRRQQGLLGVKLNNKKFDCSQKLADSCKHFFYDVPTAGKCGTDVDGKHYIQIFTINQELLHKLAARSADAAFHKFLQACYGGVCEIHAKRLEAAKAALKADQDNSKKCQNEAEKLRKEQSSRSADRILLQNQKIKKPRPAFDKGDFKTWSSLSAEDAQESKDRLTAKKTELLQKINDYEKQIQQFTTELESFQKKVDEFKPKLEAASDEKQYKDIRLSFRN
jgi:glycyl-tRNA synthetase beta subunit